MVEGSERQLFSSCCHVGDEDRGLVVEEKDALLRMWKSRHKRRNH
jgi:hypothetical protein